MRFRAVTSVKDQGATEIDGEPVRRLSAVIDQDAPDDEGLLRPGTKLDVYLDTHGRVRRIVHRREVGKRSVQRGTLNYLDLNSPESVEPPPPGSTISSQELDRPTP